MDQTVKTLLQDLGQLKDWLTDQMELDHELLVTGKIDRGFKEFGDHNTLVPFYQFLNQRKDLKNTLRIRTIDHWSGEGVRSYVVDQTDRNGKRPFTHLMLRDRINEVLMVS